VQNIFYFLFLDHVFMFPIAKVFNWRPVEVEKVMYCTINYLVEGPQVTVSEDHFKILGVQQAKKGIYFLKVSRKV